MAAASPTTTTTGSTATTNNTNTASGCYDTAGNMKHTSKEEFQMGRDEIMKSALAKTVELRALHAALQNGNSSSLSRSHSRPLFAQDYPVFTPTCDQPLPAYHRATASQSRPLSANYSTDTANHSCQTVLWDSANQDMDKHQTVPHSHVCQGDNLKLFADLFANRSITAIRSPKVDYIAKSSRRSSLNDVKSLTSCYKFRPSVTSGKNIDNSRKLDNKCYRDDAAVPFTDSSLSYQSQPRNQGMNFTWLFPRFKKKKNQNKYLNENSNSNSSQRVVEPKPASCTGSELGMISAERLKKKLMEALESRDSALMAVSEMKTSLYELTQKLEQVESYCQELKRSMQLQQTGQVQGFRVNSQLNNFQKHERNSVLENNSDKGMPVSEDVLIEGFLQVVSEARLSVKQLCKILLIQIEDSEDDALVDNLNMLLEPYHQSLASIHSKFLLYHLEAIINQALFQDFENCTFQRNGSPELLNPDQQRQAKFASYMALQDLSWNDVLSKGTKHYSPEFSKFCDQKMNCIISLLNWTKPWPEHLLQAFFVSSKGIWLLHLLAFSFDSPLRILRVEEQINFDPQYMDDILADRNKSRGPSRVKAMVMPGFYVRDKVLRCKVICKYKPT